MRRLEELFEKEDRIKVGCVCIRTLNSNKQSDIMKAVERYVKDTCVWTSVPK